MPAFEELGLCEEILRMTREKGWSLPTDIQDETIPLVLGGGDVLAAAETGSGKTGAFCLPILQVVHESLRAQKPTSSQKKHMNTDTGDKRESLDIKMNVEDRDVMLTISPSGLECQSRDQYKWIGGRATVGVVGGGKYFYECKVEDEGLCRVGYSTLASTYEVGIDNSSYGYGGTGKKSNGKKFLDYGEAYKKGDIIGCYLDLDEGGISFSKNGKNLGLAFQLPKNYSTPLFPSIVLKNAQISLEFYGMDSVLPGFIPLSQADDANAVKYHDSSIDYTNQNSSQKKCQPLAVILEPARDLAEQVHTCISEYKKYFTSPVIRNNLCIGGANNKKLFQQLKLGSDIVVGTPYKVLDLVEIGILDLSLVRFYVLDEADRLANSNDVEVIEKIFQRIPKTGSGDQRLQVCFFSATLQSPEVSTLAEKLCQHPVWVDLKGKDALPETVHQLVIRLNPGVKSWSEDMIVFPETDGVHERKISLKEILSRGYHGDKDEELQSERLKVIKPHVLIKLIDSFNMNQCMIFCRTNLDCDLLENFMITAGGGTSYSGKKESGKENIYSCRVIAGMRTMEERREALQAFKEGYVRFLICTDVAARGIDIQGLPFVVNMTLPDLSEDYIHRIGRVGRSNFMGLAISIVADENIKEKVWYHTCKNRGKGCKNRKILQNGGCTTWYNESNLLLEIESRLKQKIDSLSYDLALPDHINSSGGLSQYGRKKSWGSNEPNEHLELLLPTVKELAEIEKRVQQSWQHINQKLLHYLQI